MTQSKEHLKPFIISTIVGLMVIVLLAYPEIAYSQECIDQPNSNSPTSCNNRLDETTNQPIEGPIIPNENLPTLVITDLLPSTETKPNSIYEQAALFAPDGNIVRFFYLADAAVMSQAPIIKLQRPLLGKLLLPSL